MATEHLWSIDSSIRELTEAASHHPLPPNSLGFPHEALCLYTSRSDLCLLTSSSGRSYLTLSRWIYVG